MPACFVSLLAGALALCVVVQALSDKRPPTCTRHRKPWQALTEKEQNLYISGFKLLADTGKAQAFTSTHVENAVHRVYKFLPWHRKFIYEFENAIRALGGEYECFALPVWDWTLEPRPGNIEPDISDAWYVLHSGLGGNPKGECLNDGSVFSEGQYEPVFGECLIRDVQYDGNPCCTLASYSGLMDVIESSHGLYKNFRSKMEIIPHAYPHSCVGGAMATGWAPDDPLFWMHHAFIDYIWALWADCHDYENVNVESYSDIYTGDVSEMMDMGDLPHVIPMTAGDVMSLSKLGVSYERGYFWENARVDTNPICLTSDVDWFVSTMDLPVYEQDMPHDIYDQVQQDISDANPDRSLDELRPDITHEWAKRVCEMEESVAGKVCELPAMDEFDDCSDMMLNPETMDIDITLDELLAKKGLTECMKETRKYMFQFATYTKDLLALCAGCYDNFCDRDVFMDSCMAISTRKESGLHSNANANDVTIKVNGQQSESIWDFYQQNARFVMSAIVVVMIFAALVFSYIVNGRGKKSSTYDDYIPLKRKTKRLTPYV